MPSLMPGRFGAHDIGKVRGRALIDAAVAEIPADSRASHRRGQQSRKQAVF